MTASRISLVVVCSGTLAYFLAGLGVTAMHAITYLCAPALLWAVSELMSNSDASAEIDRELDAVINDPVFK